MRSTFGIKIYIISLAILALLTANMYLPALPLLQHELHATVHASQMTISFYMLGLALGMLFYGPLSDTFGRKKIISIGLLIYIIGVLVSIFGHTILVFSISRVIQAFGAAAVLSLWQALAIDFFKEHALKMIATGYIAIGCVPAIAPVIGSYLTVSFGWRSIFVLLAIYSVLALLTTRMLLKKGIAKTTANPLQQMATDYKTLLKSKTFLLLAVFSSFLYSGLYMFMAQTPHLLHALHYSTKAIGLFFIPISIAFILGGIIARNLFQDNKNNLAILGKVFWGVGAIIQIAISIFGLSNHWYMLITPMTIMTIGTGILLPLTVSKAMKLHSEIAGSSASLLGFTQNAMAFALSSVGSFLSNYGKLGLTISLIAIAVIIIFKGSYIRRKQLFV